MKCHLRFACISALISVCAIVTGAAAAPIQYFEDFEDTTGWSGITTVDVGPPHNNVLQQAGTGNFDVPGVDVSEGTVRVSVDYLAHGADGGEWRYVYLGDSTSLSDSNAYFGLRMSGGNLKFTWKDGAGDGSGGTDIYSSTNALNDTWYTFVADAYFNGPKANTWDLSIYDASGALIESATDLGFRRNDAGIDRLGFSYSGGTGDFVQLDNLGIYSIPEPGSLTMVIAGGAVLALGSFLRRRRPR